VPLKDRGRPAKWCSSTCRHRAWEQSRAAASGRAAVDVVHQQVTVEPPRPRQVITRQARPAMPRGKDWPPVLAELARQLDAGRIYARDLPALAPELQTVIDAYNRATGRR
jgi:hypothetical protein